MMVVLAACGEERDRLDAGSQGARVHRAGILDPASDDFHGKELARHHYSFSLCASCHGSDLNGGNANVSCNACHRAGPTACTTCHRDGPRTNAHVTHRVTGMVACAECHAVPASWDAEGHILRDGKTDPAPAEITFGTRAGANASFDGDRCSNVICHGATLVNGGGTATNPRWTDSGTAGTCAGCHASPPPSHAQDQCASCHPVGVAHIDGVVQVGTTTGCDGCHGSAASPAPPRDLAGNQFTTSIGVGAHQAHLNAAALRGPIACATCHQVPLTTTAAGHIDSPLPAEVVPALGWDRASATCTTAWCHGSARPVWTQQGGATCGSCHGVPPATPNHAPNLPISACASCHSRSVTPQGSILFINGSTQHLDGDVDVD